MAHVCRALWIGTRFWMSRLYILGGKQRDPLLGHGEEWNRYEAALLLEVDTDSGAVRTAVEYETPTEARPDEGLSSSLFKSGTLVGNKIYACTSTEVLVFALPAFERLNYISLPCFNDLHHVTPARDGNLLVVSTGLDMVVRVTAEGRVLEEWDVLQQPAWQRFSRDIDYRKIASTKPHRSHPNFVFELGDEVWVTRFEQRDAICLTDPRKRIDISVESPHDGLVYGDSIYFTVVDGRLVVANVTTLAVEAVVDLKVPDDPSAILGWCRGLLPVSGGRVWVGFSRIRRTRFEENILWVKRILREGTLARPTYIALYDIAGKRRLQEINLEPHGMNVIFSILSAP
jgi:hypothetical protein